MSAQATASVKNVDYTGLSTTKIFASTATALAAPAAGQNGSGSLAIVQTLPNGTITEKIIGLLPIPGLFRK